jgi:hypothetical protein
MSKAADLMGIGFSWPQAQNLGYNNIAITAAGSTSTDATACDPQNSVFVMTATGADGIRMSTSVPLLRPIIVVNTSGSTGKVYPFTGGNFNGGSTDAGISVATQKSMFIMRVSSTSWISILSA